MHADNRKKKDTLIFGKGPTDRLDDTTVSAETEYSINFQWTTTEILLKSTLQWKQQLFICHWSKSVSIQTEGFWNKRIVSG